MDVDEGANRLWSEPVPRLSVPTLSEIMNLDSHSVSEAPGAGRSPLR